MDPSPKPSNYFLTMLRNTSWMIAWAVLPISQLVSAVANSSFNPISSPDADDNAVPGTTFLVVWQPTTTDPVSLFVRNFGETTGVVIADSISATLGKFNWAVPIDFGINNTDPYDYEMRIYNGSLGVDTTDVAPFESREYSWSSGYFSVANYTYGLTTNVDEYPTATHGPHFPGPTSSIYLTNMQPVTAIAVPTTGDNAEHSTTSLPTANAVSSHASRIGIVGFCLAKLLAFWTGLTLLM